VMSEAVKQSAPVVRDLPAHFTEDYGERARSIARQFGIDVDLLREKGKVGRT